MNLQEKKEMSPKAQIILFRIVYSIVFTMILSMFIQLDLIKYGAIALTMAIASLFFITDKKMLIAIEKTRKISDFIGKRRFYMCAVFVIGLTEFISLVSVVVIYHSKPDAPVSYITNVSFILSCILGYLVYKLKVKFLYKFCGFGKETEKWD